MMRSMFSGVSGLKNHQTAMDVIGNNVANVNTAAYKASKVVFQDIVSQTVSEATAATANVGGQNSKQIGLGMSIAGISKDMNLGEMPAEEDPKKAVREYDFRTANKFTKEHIRTVEAVIKNFAHLLSSYFVGMLRTSCEIEVLSMPASRS